jgi:hypothetical protein
VNGGLGSAAAAVIGCADAATANFQKVVAELVARASAEG